MNEIKLKEEILGLKFLLKKKDDLILNLQEQIKSLRVEFQVLQKQIKALQIELLELDDKNDGI